MQLAPLRMTTGDCGFVDHFNAAVASGWVKARGSADPIVIALAGERVIAEAVASEMRADLPQSAQNFSYRGFTLRFSDPLPYGSDPIICIVEDNELIALPRVETATTRMPLPPEELAFYIDTITTDVVSGWTALRTHLHERILVELVIGNAAVSTIADLGRPDLAQGGIGDGFFGFELQLTGLHDASGQGEIRAYLASNPSIGPLSTIPIEIPQRQERLPTSPTLKGAIDHCDSYGARGWAWSPDFPEATVQVHAQIDGVVIGRALACEHRADLAEWNIGTSNYGFEIKFSRPIVGRRSPVFELSIPSFESIVFEREFPAVDDNVIPWESIDASTDLTRWHSFYSNPGPDYQDSALPADGVRARGNTDVLAFFLPQFHAIEENDVFWGRRFTEWRQLARALPRFPGHYQPRIPRDLGFYDLTISEIYKEQSRLAGLAGVSAFGIYYYWLEGRRILDQPTEKLLTDRETFPFFLIWANESWTRTWDGSETEVLLEQRYDAVDEDRFLDDISRHMAHPKYYKLLDRPLFIIYRPSSVPDARATFERWRAKLSARLLTEPLLYMAQAFDEVDPRQFGLDGAIEFPPHKLSKQTASRRTPDAYASDFAGRVISYDHFVSRSLGEPNPPFPLIKTAVPSWDNDSRRPGRGLMLEGSSPAKFGAWVAALSAKQAHQTSDGRNIIAINAWNEWAEGAYLEPDVHYGHAYLNALNTSTSHRPTASTDGPSGVTVICPCYNHAEFLPDRLASILNQTLLPDEIVFLDDCSTDNSVDVARTLLEKGGVPYRIVVNTQNSGGPFPQWISGIELAKSDLIWIAETDDFCESTFLENIIDTFRGTPGCSGVFGRSSCVDEDGIERSDLDDYFTQFDNLSWTQPWHFAAEELFRESFAVCNVIPNASSFVFRKPKLSAVEEDRLRSFSFAGDWYFYALILRGGRLAYDPRAGSFFRVRRSSASRDKLKTEVHIAEHRQVIAFIDEIYGLSEETIAAHVGLLERVAGLDLLVDDFVPRNKREPGARGLRICVAAHSFEVGGGEIVPLTIANELKLRGHSVTYLIVDPVPSGVRGRLRSDIPVYTLSDVLDDFPAFVRAHQFDVINSHNVSVDYALYLRRIQVPCAYVASLHGGYENAPDVIDDDFRSYIRDLVERWLYLSAKNLVPLALDEGRSSRAIKVFNAAPAVSTPAPVSLRDKLSLSQEACIFVLCSRAIIGKGWDIAIDVTRALKAEGHSVHLVLIGDGVELDHYKAYADDSDDITFTGSVQDPIAIMQECDVAIFPSTYIGETAPLFLLEALACGLPIVTTDIGEIPAMLEDAGMIVPAHVPRETLVRAIQKAAGALASSPSIRRSLGQTSLERAKHFSMNALIERYIATFREIAEQK